MQLMPFPRALTTANVTLISPGLCFSFHNSHPVPCPWVLVAAEWLLFGLCPWAPLSWLPGAIPLASHLLMSTAFSICRNPS